MNLPNIGPLLLRALQSQDMYLAGQYLADLLRVDYHRHADLRDILLAVLDPRIRTGGARA